MTRYVRGSKYDKWHWCKNCTQYPDLYIHQEISSRPIIELCEQCKTKDYNGNCQSEETSKAEEPRLKRDIPVFCDPCNGDQS